MNDHLRTKAELIEELESLRKGLPEETLLEELTRRQVLFEQSPDGVLIIDPKTAGFIEFNTAAHQQLGYTRDEFAKLAIPDIEALETLEETKKTIAGVLRNGRADFETIQRTKQGDLRYVRVTAQIVDIKGDPVYHCVWRDTTERKLVEEALIKEQALLKTTLEATADGILVVATDGSWSRFNQKFLDMWGIPSSISEARNDQAALDHVVGSLTNPEAFIAKVQELYQDLESESLDTFELKDGRFFERFSMPQWLEGEVIGRVWSFRDITERKQTEEELMGTKFVLDTTTDAVYWMQQDGQFVDVNDAACEKLGYTRDELLTMHVNDMNPDYPTDRWPATWELIKQEKSVNIEAHHKTKDGVVYPVEIQANYVQFGDKERICSYVRDITERKQAEEVLRESRDRYLSLFDNMLDGIYRSTPEGKFVDVNHAMVNMFGYSSSEEMLRVDIKKDLYFAPEERGSHVLDTGHEEIEVYRMRRKDGNEIWVEDHGHYVHDEQGRIIYHEGLLRDITERKQVGDALREAKETAESYLNISAELIFRLDAQGTITLMNDSGHRLLDYNPRELIGKNWFDTCLPKNIRSEIWAVFQKLMNGDIANVAIYENNIITKNGNIRSLLWHNTLLKDENGRINGLLSSAQDITERKQVEEEISQSTALLKSIYDTIPEAIVATNINREIVSVNKGFHNIFGFSDAEILGKQTAYFYESEAEYLRLGKLRYNLSAKEQLEPYLNNYRKASGEVFPGETLGIPILNSEAERIGFLGVIRDISDRLRLESQLRQSQKLESIGTMVGGISHEFNNVLQSMFLYASLVQSELPENELLRSNFQHILDGGNRARDLIKQVLTFSRKTEVEMKPRYLHELVQELLLLERASMPANIDIQQDIDMNCGPVLCDKTQFHQILINLCNNAQHAMAEKGGTLTVSLKPTRASLNNSGPETDALELKLSDTGHGIEATDLERIFDPFFTTKQIGQGTGLGLSVIHGIVEMMEGQISVTSEIGKGTTFRVLFPVTDVTAKHDEANSLTVADGAGCCVLLVDDEESIRSVTQIILRRKGFKVDSASDGTQALELFKANPGKYDLIVTDQSMPKMSGVELTKAIRRDNSEIPIILSTGHLGMEEEKGLKDISITAFIQKPWTAEELIRRIQELDDK